MIRPITLLSYFTILVGCIFVHQSCESEAMLEVNPFEEESINQDTVNLILEDVDPNSIAGLYQNIFKPTCANVGCHDGTFEPDFRTIESSYHTLVYKDIIKNDGSQTYRVDPGNPDQSSIIKRLNGSISPIMPIEIEPDSDWDIKGDEYIQQVRNWITNGALDLAGNAPRQNVLNPSLLGVMAKNDGQLLGRSGGYGAIIVPDVAQEIEIFLGFDPINLPQTFSTNELIFGYENEIGFQPEVTVTMEILNTPISDYGLYGKIIEYTHKAMINFSDLSLNNDQYFMRARVKDGTQPIIELPADNGLYYIKEYMSFNRSN